MDYNAIKDHLEKYWEGESSLQEEADLRAYFRGADVHPDFEKEAELFKYYEVESTKMIESKDFDQTVLGQIRPQTRVVSIRRKTLRYAMGIAASLLLLLTIYPSLENALTDEPQMALEDTYQTPEEAYEATKKALMLVSRKLNKGTEKAAAGLTKVNEATDMFHLE